MSPNYKVKKVGKKQRRCEAIISNECGIRSSDEPTRYVGILNAGLATGLTEERVLECTSSAARGCQVEQLLMLPNKSFCFVVCASVADAESIYEAMHNVAAIGQNNAVVYLAYFESVPASCENVWSKKPPPGLIVLEDFITGEEEAELLQAVLADTQEPVADSGPTSELKHRRVKHFGYEFLYGVNNVDVDKPLDTGIPADCDKLWPRLEEALHERGCIAGWTVPDQLTVNEYEPGHGIPPHVDTHSAFLDPILSLSLQDDVVMEFRRGNEKVPVVLRRRSLLVMSGEARYDWTHGITPRIYDVVPATASAALTTKRRSKRTSLTFRRLRRGPCDCQFHTLCDTRLEKVATQSQANLAEVARQLEELNVHHVYDQIAPHFSETRHSPWPKVTKFLESFEAGSLLLDIGCGNGKYLTGNPAALTLGCDRSSGLLDVCVDRKLPVFRCDCLNVPVRDQSVDGCFSIAVIHHLATPDRRLAAVREMSRLLRPGGRALIYVWARNQQADAKKSSYLRQNKAVNREKVTEEEQRQLQRHHLQNEAAENIVALPVHTNRTDFQQQDVLVPWKLKGKVSAAAENVPTAPATFLRYYHVFEEGELESLVRQLPEVELVESYYDQGNHCVIFRRV